MIVVTPDILLDVIQRIKGAPPQSSIHPRLTDARHWAQGVEAAIRERRFFPANEERRHTVADAIDRYLEQLPLRGLRDPRSRERHLQYWRKRLGHVLLCDLTPALIAEERDRLARTPVFANRKTIKKPLTIRTSSTVRRYLASLSHALSVAERDWGWLRVSPMRSVAKPAESRGRVRYLAEQEMEVLLRECAASGNPDLYAIVVLALATGMRRGELLGLEWPQVDLTRGVITLHCTKYGDRRGIPVVGHALELLEQRRNGTDGVGLVFAGRKPGKAVDRNLRP
jgi:integrase